jgi:hypothetical protein
MPGNHIKAATGNGAISRSIEHAMGAHMPRGASGNLRLGFFADFIAEVMAVLYGEVCTSATDMIVTAATRPVQAVALLMRRCAAGRCFFSPTFARNLNELKLWRAEYGELFAPPFVCNCGSMG